MEVFKTYLFFSGYDEGHPYLIDTIWHKNNWWLVATYLEHHATREKIPDRLVLMDGLTVSFQEVENQPYRFLLNNSLPKSVLDGEPQNGYVIENHPSALSGSRGSTSIH